MVSRRWIGIGLALLMVTVAGTLATAGVAAPPAARAASPADGLVGQQVTACNYDADLEVVVVQADLTRSVVGERAPGNGLWIVALIDVTNVADKTEALTTRPLQLHDDAGNVYDVQEDPPDITAVALAYEVTPPWQPFEPGITTRSVVTFLVPADVGALTLVGKRDYC